MPFGYCGSLYHFLATPCRQVDRQTKYCTPYCNPHACALPTLSSLQISCTKEKYKEQFRVSNPCSSSIRLARLPEVISSIGEIYLVIRVDGTKFELLRRSLRIGEEQYTVDQENYNWWLYVSNAFMAAAPNEVIGGKNWNCVSGSAASLHSGCVCLKIDIYKCSLSF